MSEPCIPEAIPEAVLAARRTFPAGLVQPEGGYRFSLDPLLLAAFVRPKKGARVADLGCGCGVAALALMLLSDAPPPASVPAPAGAVGLDLDPAMAEAASDNATLLGLSGRYQARTLDLRQVKDALPSESFSMALANPPYRRPGTGLPCQGEERNRARFETEGELGDFVAAASWLLANRGSLAVVFPAARLAELMGACQASRLTPKRFKLVHSRLEEPARLALLECVKNAGDELTVEAPLILYEGRGEETRMTARALEFCPFLAKNP